jgi:hypothetical protein
LSAGDRAVGIHLVAPICGNLIGSEKLAPKNWHRKIGTEKMAQKNGTENG